MSTQPLQVEDDMFSRVSGSLEVTLKEGDCPTMVLRKATSSGNLCFTFDLERLPSFEARLQALAVLQEEAHERGLHTRVDRDTRRIPVRTARGIAQVDLSILHVNFPPGGGG